MTYSQKNPIAFNEKPASSVKMNEEFVQIYGALNEIDGALNEIDGVKAPLESPALTGSPTAPTQPASDDSTKIATTAHVLDRLQLYGIGVTTGVNVSNFDATDIPSGMYHVQNSSGTNPGIAYGFLLVERYGTGSLKQTFTHVSTATTLTMAYRTYNANTSTWNPWRQIFHQGNILGTVSQSDGIPTGAVIERGSNANGEYVKFADGTLIATHLVTLSSGEVTWTYPVLSITTPTVNGSPFVTANTTLFTLTRYTTGTTSAVLWGNASIDGGASWTRSSHVLRVSAIGRWF